MVGGFPGGLEILRDVIVFVIVEEILFFYSHWAFHSPFLYSKFHKIHHQFKSPIALAATYAHPLEVFLSNALPLATGPLLLKSHFYTTLLWFVVAIIGTQYHHCGYKFLLWPEYWRQPKFHDFHHYSFNSNFGLLGHLDKLHKTFREYDKKDQ